MELIKKIDVTNPAAKVFVVGDIHGCYSLLEEKLVDVGFNREVDLLISVGDLVDRGPESERFIEFLDYDWFQPVRGNHEEMCRPMFAGTSWHVSNGGAWYNEMCREHGHDAAEAETRRLYELPFAIEVTKGEQKFGFIHASLYNVSNWNQLEERLFEHRNDDENPFLWDRNHVRDAMHLARDDPENKSGMGNAFVVDNVDRVYFGHTPIKEPFSYGNCRWIDTGAFATENLTVEQVA